MKLYYNDERVAEFDEKSKSLHIDKAFTKIDWQPDDLAYISTFFVRAENYCMNLSNENMPDIKVFNRN